MTINLANAFHRLGYDTHILLLKNRIEIMPDNGITIHTVDFDRIFRLTVLGLCYELVTRGILSRFNRRARLVYRSLWFSRLFTLWLHRLEKRLGQQFKLIIARGFGSFEGLAGFKDPRMLRIIVNELWMNKAGWADKYFFRESFTTSPVLFNSQQVLESFVQTCQRLSVAPIQARHLLNPTDFKEIRSKAQESVTVSRPYILNVGRLEKAKNQLLLLQAFAIIHSRIPHDLVIVGSGSLKSELQRKAVVLGISERVIFTGLQENPYSWMAHADLFVLSSLHEGLPNTVIESLVCGTPVVVTRGKGGTVELMKGEQAKFIAEMDPMSLAMKIELALQSPPKIEQEYISGFDMFQVANAVLALSDEKPSQQYTAKLE